MLMYGYAKTADKLIGRSNTIFYNISSLAERYSNCRLNLLPPNNLGSNSEYEFDIKYMQWIFGNDQVFLQFMCIINSLYQGYDVFLIATDEEWSDMTMESLLKLIQQRYGISAVFIDSISDLEAAEDIVFAAYGLMNLDEDLSRYQYLAAISGGIKVEEQNSNNNRGFCSY